jgi:hypothetical protein
VENLSHIWQTETIGASICSNFERNGNLSLPPPLVQCLRDFARIAGSLWGKKKKRQLRSFSQKSLILFEKQSSNFKPEGAYENNRENSIQG